MSPTSLSPRDVLLVETVQALERKTPLDDSRALPAAAAATPDRTARIVARARSLAEGEGLEAELRQVRRSLPGLGLVPVAIGALLAVTLVAGVLGEGRALNAMAAWVALIVPNALGLVVWAVIAASAGHGGQGWLGAGLQRLARWRFGRGRRAEVLAAITRVIDRHGLGPWVWGGLNHLLWAVAYAAVIVGLLMAFAVREYRLGWETTILSGGFFDGFVRDTAWLPAQLGLPAGEALAAGGAASSAALARWLIASVATYALLPRLLALGLCLLVAARRRHRLTLDLQQPYFRKLINRFEAIAPTRVVDAEHARPGPPREASRGPDAVGGLAIVGFELPPEWEAEAGLAATAAWQARVDGTREEREAVLARLTARPPAGLLLACHAPSTPDRGTGRFLQAASHAAPTALLLTTVDGLPMPAGAPARWRAWLDETGHDEVPLFTSAAEATHWAGRPGAARQAIEAGHG